MQVTLFTPEVEGTPSTKLLAYTEHPVNLFLTDLALIWKYKWFGVTGIIFPWKLRSEDPDDELYIWEPRNLRSVFLHLFLIFNQLTMIVLVLFFALCPIPIIPFPVAPSWYILWFFAGLMFNGLVCRALNGDVTVNPKKSTIEELEKRGNRHALQNEYWIYMNGVSVGHDWLQCNVDRLSLTFGRPVVGVHNPTSGILFDLIQCLIQRNFTYSTEDVRVAYDKVKKALMDKSKGPTGSYDTYDKVVFILHSQGGIEGGLIVDWLLDELPQDALDKLEVYTFGCAANHFNNPLRSRAASRYTGATRPLDQDASPAKAIKYIEHYANEGDFVSQFGVLNFTLTPDRFVGRIFRSPKKGHLLNQHYLHEMFVFDHKTKRALDNNEFMDAEIHWSSTADPASLAVESGHNTQDTSSSRGSLIDSEEDLREVLRNINTPYSPISTRTLASEMRRREKRTLRVRDFSRLWFYRNGGSPPNLTRAQTW